VETALAMQQAAATLKEQRGGGLDFGIGLHYGTAVVGYFGVERSMSYTAIGENVSITEQIKNACEPGQILATEALAQRIEDWAILRQAGSIALSGAEQSLDLFEIMGRKS
jgi:adenylate cyclase